MDSSSEDEDEISYNQVAILKRKLVEMYTRVVNKPSLKEVREEDGISDSFRNQLFAMIPFLQADNDDPLDKQHSALKEMERKYNLTLDMLLQAEEKMRIRKLRNVMPEVTISIDSSSSDEDNSFTTQWRMPRRLIAAEVRKPIKDFNLSRPRQNGTQPHPAETSTERNLPFANMPSCFPVQNQAFAVLVPMPVTGMPGYQTLFSGMSFPQPSLVPIQQPLVVGEYGGSISSREVTQAQFSPEHDGNFVATQAQTHQPRNFRTDMRNSRDPRVQSGDPRTRNCGQDSRRSDEPLSYGEHRRRQAEKNQNDQRKRPSRWESDQRPSTEMDHNQPNDKRQKTNRENSRSFGENSRSFGENSRSFEENASITGQHFKNTREHSQENLFQNGKQNQRFSQNYRKQPENSQNLLECSQNRPESSQKHQNTGGNLQKLQENSQDPREIAKNPKNTSKDSEESSKKSEETSSKSVNSTKLLKDSRNEPSKENCLKTADKSVEKTLKRSYKTSSNFASSSSKESQKSSKPAAKSKTISNAAEKEDKIRRTSEKSQSSASESRTKVLHLDQSTQQKSTELSKAAEETSKKLQENPQELSQSSNKEKSRKSSQTSTSETTTSSISLQLIDPNPSQIPGFDIISLESLPLIPPDQIKKENELDIEASMTALMDAPCVLNVEQIKKEIKKEYGNDDETDSNCDSNADTEDEMDENPIAGIEEDMNFLEEIQNGAGASDVNSKVTLEQEAEEDAAEAMQSFIRCVDFHKLIETSDNSSQDYISNSCQNSVSNPQSSPRYEKPTSPLQNDENWDLPIGEPEDFDFDSQKDDDDEVFIPMIPTMMRLPPTP